MVSDYYGDTTRWFVGRVVSNIDPEKAGRLQVRIFGIHSDDVGVIPNDYLPWANVMMPATEGGTSGIGRIPQILPGALVFGVFLDGPNSQLPMVMGTVNNTETPSPTQRAFGPASTIVDTYPSNRVSMPGGIVVDQSVTAANNSADMVLKRNAAMKFFVDNFGNPVIAAGIVGNLEAESGLNTSAQGDLSIGGSYGIAQWYSKTDRFNGLQRYANAVNKPWTDYDVQLQYVAHEIIGGPYSSSGPHTCYNSLVKCTSFEGGPVPYNATWVITDKYENPANKTSKVYQREEYARNAYTQWMGQVPTTGAQ